MLTALKEAEHGLLLTDSELRLLMNSTYNRYASCVFRILCAEELGEYYPMKRERDAAYSKLCVMLGYRDFANQVLAHHLAKERQGRIFETAENDVQFLRAAECLRGMTTAPLMAELDTQTAYTLWSRAGSWAGAMEFAGLDPLSGDSKRDAIKWYAIGRASPELLPKSVLNRLTHECISELHRICDEARKSEQYPTSEDVGSARKLIKQRQLSVRSVLNKMGLDYIVAPALRAGTQTKKTKGAATGWKAYNHWWLNSIRYKSIQRAAVESAQKRKQELQEGNIQNDVNIEI